jgi:tRNA(Ile2) C34 agmatinyltransferase TiaS
MDTSVAVIPDTLESAARHQLEIARTILVRMAERVPWVVQGAASSASVLRDGSAPCAAQIKMSVRAILARMAELALTETENMIASVIRFSTEQTVTQLYQTAEA